MTGDVSGGFFVVVEGGGPAAGGQVSFQIFGVQIRRGLNDWEWGSGRSAFQQGGSLNFFGGLIGFSI